VNCAFNVSVIYCDYIVDEFVVIFCIFLIFFSEIINFRRPQWAAENKEYYFRQAFIFGGQRISRRKLTIFSGQVVAAENNSLLSAAVYWPAKISYFQRLDSGRRKYSLIFG
jgi:hypothetical protein